MRLYIPSRTRWDHIVPLRYLNDYWMFKTNLVVHKDEAEDYANAVLLSHSNGEIVNVPNIIAIEYTGGIAEKRTLIGKHAEENGYDKFMMIDDDLNFLRRLYVDAVNQVTIRYDEKDEIDKMLRAVEHYLDKYAQVAIGMREGNNHAGVGEAPLITECTKAIRAVGYQTKAFRSVDTNRVRTMSDYDTTLQILEQGKKNAVLNWWMSGQKGTNTAGGCSIWRTHEVHEQSVAKMVQMHPGICTARMKENKTGGEFGVRPEVTIKWKKAYEQGRANNDSKCTEHS